jgi:hypothetical protein
MRNPRRPSSQVRNYGNEMLIAGFTEGAALRITAVTKKNEEEVKEDWGCTAEEVTEDVEEVADQKDFCSHLPRDRARESLNSYILKNYN